MTLNDLLIEDIYLSKSAWVVRRVDDKLELIDTIDPIKSRSQYHQAWANNEIVSIGVTDNNMLQIEVAI